jgi:hypothetical protein
MRLEAHKMATSFSGETVSSHRGGEHVYYAQLTRKGLEFIIYIQREDLVPILMSQNRGREEKQFKCGRLPLHCIFLVIEGV